MAESVALDPTRCDFIKKDGSQCARKMGCGTKYEYGRCKTHRGNSPTHRRAAARLTIASMAEESGAEPHEVLLKTIRLSWGAVTFLREKLDSFCVSEEELTELVEFGSNKTVSRQTDYGIWLQIYGEWVDRAAKHAKLALDAGVAERQVAIAEQQGQLMAEAIRSILNGLGLKKEQHDKAPALVRSTMLALAAG